ncbi:MAG: hypothetical protein IKO30_07465 [Lachnospiraceae bacterium]|nr:hypothetical protein [Lachnospiraceae bacterium]
MSFQLDQAEEYTFFLDDDIMEWLFDGIEKDPMLLREPITDEEDAAFFESGQTDLLDINYLRSASELYQNFALKGLYESIDGSIERERGNEGTDILFIMDLSEGHEATITFAKYLRGTL